MSYTCINKTDNLYLFVERQADCCHLDETSISLLCLLWDNESENSDSLRGNLNNSLMIN